jgi:hypothetical protein
MTELESEEDERFIEKPIIIKVMRTIKTLKKEGDAKTIEEIVRRLERRADNEKNKLKELENDVCQEQGKVIVIF